jgi:hypothetical protein
VKKIAQHDCGRRVFDGMCQGQIIVGLGLAFMDEVN